MFVIRPILCELEYCSFLSSSSLSWDTKAKPEADHNCFPIVFTASSTFGRLHDYYENSVHPVPSDEVMRTTEQTPLFQS